MAWLGEGLSTLRGQITSVANFTKEVLSDGKEEGDGDEVQGLGLAAAQQNIRELEENCLIKDVEISSLRRRVEELEAATRGDGDGEARLEPVGSTSHYEAPVEVTAKSVAGDAEAAALMGRVQHLEAENKLMRKTCQEYEEQLEEHLGATDADQQVKQQLQAAQREIAALQAAREDATAAEQCLRSELEAMASLVQQLEARLVGLQDDNAALTASLEDLDQEHQINIDKLLATKKAVQDENSSLHKEISELRNQLDSTALVSAAETRNVDIGTDATDCATFHDLLKLVPFEVKTKENSAELVTELVKRSSDDQWKRETLERKVAEVMKQLREAEAELVALRGALEERSSNDNLAVIPENSEEVEELERQVTSLEEQLREVTRSRDKLEEDVESLQEKLLTSEGDSGSVKTELKQALAKNAEVEETMNKLQQTLQETEEAFKARCNEMSLQNASLVNMSATETCLQEKVAQCEASYDELEAKYHAERNEWEGRCSELINTQNTLRKELVEAQNSALDARRMIEQGFINCQNLEEVCRHLEIAKSEAVRSSADFEEKYNNINEQLSKCIEEVDRSKAEVAELKEQLSKAVSSKEEFANKCEQLQASLANCRDQNVLENEVERWKSTAESAQCQLDEALRVREELEAECKRLFDIEMRVHRQGQLEREVSRLAEVATSTEEVLTATTEAKHALEQKLAQLQAVLEDQKSLKEDANEWREAKLAADQQLQEMSLENSKLTAEVTKLKDFEAEVVKCRGIIEILQNKVTNVDASRSDLKTQLENCELEVQRLRHVGEEVVEWKEKCKWTESQLEILKQKYYSEKTDNEKPHAEDLSGELETLKCEKERMLNVLDKKTRENSLLKSENARVMQMMAEEKKTEADDTQMARETIANLSRLVKEREADLARASSERDELVRAVTEKHAENVAYHREIVRLGQELERRASEVPDEEERSRLQDEATRHKYLQNEVQEAHDRETALMKELGRLRQHLAQLEDSHTAETMQCEEQLAELRTRLAQADDRAKSCTTALTSAQVRMNQQVEALTVQLSRAAQLRDEAQSRLGTAEDQVQRHAAALTNLQGVLEQFQQDKERDIVAATERISAQLAAANDRNAALTGAVAALEAQLAQAQQGLGAAARLTEQLDKKAVTINQLKEEVLRLNEQLQTAEFKEKSASLNCEGKIDKYLVKNLLIGYLVAPAHTKQQALRIVATVLDFNHDERCRVGLEAGSQPGGWFSSFMHPSAGPPTNQSLSEAFVRFLENESRPRPQLQLLPAVSEPQPASRSETVMTSTASASRSPLLLADVTLPTLAQFPVPRNSGSILKDVLKDS